MRITANRHTGGGRLGPRGLTIIELLVMVALVGVMMALSVSVYGHALRLSRQTVCLSNLHQLALALSTYYTENRQLPPDDRPEYFEQYLGPLVADRSTFHCPADPEEGASSYAPYYVHRREMNPRDFMLGCPRHDDGRLATVLFGSAGTEGAALGEITHNHRPVKVGDRVTGGLLQFADGSVASLEDRLSVDILTSFQRADGSYYTVLRIPTGEEGTIGLDVNPRSRFEVVTPAAIAGSEGTRFFVKAERDEKGNPACVVYVEESKVRMTTRGRRPARRLIRRLEAYRGERPSGRIVKWRKPKGWKLPWLPRRRKHHRKSNDD